MLIIVKVKNTDNIIGLKEDIAMRLEGVVDIEMVDVVDTIAEIDAKPADVAPKIEGEWISVDERLPEENGRYLVCVHISHLAFENLTTVAIMEYGINHGFYLYNETEKVTHWMPLPEAPKMKGGAE